MKKYIITFAILVSALAAGAQDVIWKMTYDVGFPFSATKEFADQVSWRGLSLDVDRFVTENVAVGTGVSWSVFLEKDPDSYWQKDQLLLHGTQVRYINNIPLMARISWFQPMDELEPYFTLGIGTVWQENRRDMGLWEWTDNYWQFALAPEVGVIVPMGTSVTTLKLKYTHGFSTDSGAPTLSYLSVGVGIGW
jgi:hypothetical protein